MCLPSTLGALGLCLDVSEDGDFTLSEEEFPTANSSVSESSVPAADAVLCARKKMLYSANS